MDIEETRPELDIVRHATKELRVSDRFKQVLKVFWNAYDVDICSDSISFSWQAVLTVGNALNGSSFRGNARGFQLEALLKVSKEVTKMPKTLP